MNTMKPEEKYAKEIDGLSEHTKRAVIALAQYQNNEPRDQLCFHCGAPIHVEGIALKDDGCPSSWAVSCPCGKCNTTFVVSDLPCAPDCLLSAPCCPPPRSAIW